ncbi:glycosyltransferase family 4 protein [Desulforhopalus vacuolatus]|uniref:glycosyltransferase family 4 protein n=1 Tax=Desulforhopalus vacuolatus TaxID=40414 RepID=UPI001962AA8C|nr:glycosyltransferase family 4 protein [Desulforhopalus vacuolatus]MBM9520878.1 glycosyltransferase family 4 protein [Desulforhopalus vacuolatus]
MRILFLSQWFQPEPFFKGLPFAKKLMAQGHQVEVLTGFPNYPGGKLYPGYGFRFFQRENMEGIRVNRVPLYPSHDQSGFRRIVNYLSFALSTLFIGPWVVRKPDVIYVFNLITLACTASLLKKIYGCKIVYDVQDLWPESVASSGMLSNALLQKLLHRWCLWAYRRADKIAVLSPGFKQKLVARGIPEERIEVIYNWCDETSLASIQNDRSLAGELHLEDTFNVVFAGTIGIMQALDVVLNAAQICTKEMPEVRFVLVGGGVDVARLKSKAKMLHLDNVVFVPRIPISDMGKVFALADVLLVHLKDDPLFWVTIPSKTQVYMWAGLPIIMGVKGNAADLVRKAHAGLVCEPENSQSMVQAVSSLYHMNEKEREKMGMNGNAFYKEWLSSDVGTEKFLRLFS